MGVFTDMWGSKKFRAGILGSLIIFLGQLFPAWANDSLLVALAGVSWGVVFAPLMTAIGAQGIADFGKEAAKQKQDNGSGSQT